jgi:hypothetical protein
MTTVGSEVMARRTSDVKTVVGSVSMTVVIRMVGTTVETWGRECGEHPSVRQDAHHANAQGDLHIVTMDFA